VNLHSAAQILELYLQTLGAPALMLWGPPGVGKSSLIRSVAQKYGYAVSDLRLSQLSPVDLRGLPTVDREKMASRWLRPVFLPVLEDVTEMQASGSKGLILLLDEVNTAPVQTQAAAFQLVLDRAVGEYRIPVVSGFPIHIVLAGNRASDRSVTHQMPTPLLNRMGHLEIEPDAGEFYRYGLENGLDARVLAYLIYSGTEKLLALPSRGEHAFPTPRSWEFVSRIITGREWDADLQRAVSTLVGDAAAFELGAHIERSSKLPNPEDVILRGFIPEGLERENVAVQWSYVTSLTAKVMELGNALEDAHISNWVRALSRLSPEYANLGLVTPLRGDLSKMARFIRNADYKAWNTQNVALLI